MSPRLTIPPLGAAVLLAWLGLALSTCMASEAAPTAALSGAVAALHSGQQQYLGAFSCNATACHGSQVPRRRGAGTRGDEFVLWSDHDPHARAAVRLTSPESLAIMDRLGVTATEGGHLSCVGCHRPVNASSPPLAGDHVPPGDQLPLAGTSLEGVSCEACHGPSEHWIASHVRGASAPQAGRIQTENLLVRARLCADCHIGSADREVNHDLIAAGHPALRFEFASYYEKLPKHWHDDAERRHPQYYQRLWSAGQIATAEASLALLEARAERANQPESGGVWPEFAEYACSDCHRALSATSESLLAGTHTSLVNPRWNQAHAEALVHHGRILSNTGEETLVGPFAELQRVMASSLKPSSPEVLALSRQTRSALNEWLAREGHAGALELTAGLPRQVAVSLAGSANERAEVVGYDLTQWESAANVYAAVAVLEQAHRARQGMSPQMIEPSTAAVLQSRQNLANWFTSLHTEAQPMAVENAQRQFLAALLEASQHIQRRGE